jgi:hypothetical protein
MLLALTLVLTVAFAGVGDCAILPIDGPTTGDGGLDGDHPWGGDRTPTDDPDVTLDKFSRYSSITGLPLIDVVINTYFQTSLLRTDESTYRKKVDPYTMESPARPGSGTTYRTSGTSNVWRLER